MIVDCFSFFKEFDILEIRLNTLDKYVDKFVLTESEETFTGIPKPLYFQENKKSFQKFLHKIVYIKTSKVLSEADTWSREHNQNNANQIYIKNLNSEDIIIISDCDEIPNLSKIDFSKIEAPQVFLNKNFTLRLNLMTFNNNKTCKRTENIDKTIGKPWKWFGSTISKQKYIKNQNFWGWNNLREARQSLPQIEGGWHFSSCMSNKDIIDKVQSYSHADMYGHIKDENLIAEYIKINKDFVNYDMRDIKQINISEDDLPKYIVDNKEKYSHLFK
jgi:beta-1,4-mannosyl-glycoprotein beta-1,4-N-acetylglucosaminyltransferase